MAKITDPDSLTYELNTVALGTANVVVDLANSRIELNKAALLSDDGVTCQALYSKLKEVWKNENTAIMYDFPMEAITPEQFEFIKGWELADINSVNLIRDAGFAYRTSAGTEVASYMGFDSVFPLDNNAQSGGDQVYVELNPYNGTRQDMYITGQANQPIQIYGDATHGNVEYRNNNLRFFVREPQKQFGFTSVSALNVALPLTYKKYAFPLSNGADTNIGASATTPIADSAIASGGFPNAPDLAPYSGMSITSGNSTQIDISGNLYDFDIIIDGNGGSAEQIYAFVHYQLRRNADVDVDGTGVIRGEVGDDLVEFVGSDLYTRRDTQGRGVYIANTIANDANRVHFEDDTGASRSYDYLAAGTIVFNQNLIDDPATKYTMFFATDDAGDNLGYDFGTPNAIIVQDSTDTNIAGDLHNTTATPTGSEPVSGTTDGSAAAGGFVMTSVLAGTNNWDDTGNGQFAGKVLVVTGQNAGYYNIVSNTTTTITVDKAFEATSTNGMTWEVRDRSNGSLTWDFLYDSNEQRGVGMSPADAPVVIVAIGLNSAQYVKTDTNTISRNVGQNFSLVAALERNYNDPV